MEIVKIKKITKLNKVYDRYDLTVSSTNNFFANGILIHNTSTIIGNLQVKEPIKIPFYKKWFNMFVDKTGWFKKARFIDTEIKYGPIFSSRTVIKNRYINSEVGQGFYSQDIWSEWGNIVYPYLEEGMTVYGEIVGYLTGSDSMIQKTYDYGCEKGKNKLMIYRITTTNEDGSKNEWEVPEVRGWTIQLIERMKSTGDPNWENIYPIDLLYHGTLEELYPDLDTENHWHENLLERMKNDKEHFGMEENEPMCKTYEVPREGICIRKESDARPSCYKLKTISFALGEAIRMDNGEVDSEMEEGYTEN